MTRWAGGSRAAHIALAGCLLLAVACQPRDEAPPAAAAESGLPESIAQAAVGAPAWVADAYARRGFRPLWVGDRAATERALSALAGASRDGLDTDAYDARGIARDIALAGVDPARLASAELRLSDALTGYLRDLRTPPAQHAFAWRDPDLAQRSAEPAALLDEAARAPSPVAWLNDALRMHPLYEAARNAKAIASLDQLRVLPADPGQRYILVDASAAELRMIERGAVVDRMKVVVGKPGMDTPTLAGLIRYATYNPYWNLPPDLSAERAERILFEGPALLEAQRLEVLSDWSPQARVLDPAVVDWSLMAARIGDMRLRQRPGGRNVMGAVKFMLPNPLGIYLHDTPDRWAFARASRRMSSGCVRVEDADRLARWLFGRPPAASGAPEERIDLPTPVPVYIIHMRGSSAATA
jgi:murein L,D-transpeptidase YcbB/YkuD